MKLPWSVTGTMIASRSSPLSPRLPLVKRVSAELIVKLRHRLTSKLLRSSSYFDRDQSELLYLGLRGSNNSRPRRETTVTVETSESAHHFSPSCEFIMSVSSPDR